MFVGIPLSASGAPRYKIAGPLDEAPVNKNATMDDSPRTPRPPIWPSGDESMNALRPIGTRPTSPPTRKPGSITFQRTVPVQLPAIKVSAEKIGGDAPAFSAVFLNKTDKEKRPANEADCLNQIIRPFCYPARPRGYSACPSTMEDGDTRLAVERRAGTGRLPAERGDSWCIDPSRRVTAVAFSPQPP